MKTGRLVSWLAVGLGMTVAGVSACGSDGTTPATPVGEAGASTEGGQGAAANTPSAGQGGAETVETMAGGGASGGAAPEPTPSAGEGGGGAAPVVESKDVNGVIHGYDEPVPNTKVFINDEQVLTDDAGRFTVKDAPDEYELAVLLEFDPYTTVYIYRGLRSRAPTINLAGTFSTPQPQAATIRGRALGGEMPYPLPFASFTQTVWESEAHGRLALETGDPPAGFDLSFTWFGSNIDKGELYALQGRSDNPANPWTGWGHRRLVIEAGGYYGSLAGSSLTDVTMTDPEDVTVSGKISVPNGWTFDYPFGYYIGPMVREGSKINAPGPFSFVVPRIDRPIFAEVRAKGDSGSTTKTVLVDPDAPLNIDVPLPPQQISPPDGATDVNGKTEFVRSDAPQNGVGGFVWTIGNLNVLMSTSETKVTIPDLKRYGLTLPKGQESSWLVLSEGPAATVDEVAELEQRYYRTSTSVAESTFAIGANRAFFTAK